MSNIPRAVIEILNKLHKAGKEAVIAGGWVRDMLLSVPSNDIDIATSATPDDLEKIFDNIKFVGRDFGVALIKHLDIELEVATFRKDYFDNNSDGRHPSSVEFCSMKEDAKRRDLTINALFYDPFNHNVIDFVNGQKDINYRVIRFVGVPEHRIKEDHIRMLRAIRFANRLNFRLSDTTRQRLSECANLLKNVAPERIALEMNKILKECDSFVFKQLTHFGLLKHIIPELEAEIGCQQPPQFHPEGDVWEHTMMAFDYMKAMDPNLECLWAVLLHDIGKPPVQFWDEKDCRWRFNNHDMVGKDIARDILARLKFSNHFQDRVCSLIENHMRFAYVDKLKKSKLKRFIFMPYFEDHCKLHKADCLSSHGDCSNIEFCQNKIKEFEVEQEKPGLPKLIVNGNTLISIGMKPGPHFKEILEYAMDGQLENKFTDEQGGIDYVRAAYKRFI